ncbi:hypothetical protein ABPG75_000862 [Micractinium tetrahymenae]
MSWCSIWMALGGRVDFARCWRVIVEPGGGRPASGLAVSRSFGDPDFKEPLHLVTATPDVIRERLLPGDEFVILASDGLASAVVVFTCFGGNGVLDVLVLAC